MNMNKLAPRNITCVANVSQYAQFTAVNNESIFEKYALLASGPVAKTAGKGLYEGTYHSLYVDVAASLMAACAVPSHASTQLVCGGGDTMTDVCPPPVPCEFNPSASTFLGDSVALGAGSLQLVRYNSVQPELSSFDVCAQQSLPVVAAQQFASANAFYVSSASAASPKKALCVAVLLAVGVAFGNA